MANVVLIFPVLLCSAIVLGSQKTLPLKYNRAVKFYCAAYIAFVGWVVYLEKTTQQC